MRHRHHVLLGRLSLGLLALIAELAGRSLTHRLDVGRHVGAPSYSSADYYPILLIVVKAGVALMLARLLWRFAKARSSALAGRRLLAAHGRRPSLTAPRVHLQLSPRLWLGSFLVTSSIFLVQTDAERLSTGRWPLLAPWLHTSALPVFAVLAVLVAIVYRAVARWLTEYERYARETVACASGVGVTEVAAPRPVRLDQVSPRALFGLSLESRPPPVAV
jgi:hypothetical protein